MVDNHDEDDEFEDEFEDYESLKDRVRRGPLLGASSGLTLVAGAVWVVLTTVLDIRVARGYFDDTFASQTPGDALWRWGLAARDIAYSVFLVALGSYVVLWLALREDSR